jgi:hypothetical protein
MHDSDLELDIGEASRVVKLPHLAQMALQGNNGPAPVTHHGLPGVGSQKLGSGTGPMGSVSNRTGPTGLPQFSMEAPRPELLQPRRRSGLLPLIIGGGVVLAAVIGLLVFLAVRGDNVDDEPIARRTTTRSTDNLGKDYTADFTSTRPSKSDDGTKVEIENPKDSGSKGARTAKKPRTGNGESQSNTTSANTRSGGDDEVDLGSGSKDKVVQGFLDPGVVQQAYRKYSISMQRCFEQALKKDPYLKAPKATVAIEVSPAGRVTRVSIPALSGKYLGGCLTGAIKRWKFQRSTKGLSTTFPVVFKS